MTTPPGEPAEDDDAPKQPGSRASWAWEPDLDAGDDAPPPPAPEPPPLVPESGEEMLARLRERGLISDEEYEQRLGAMGGAAPAAEPVIGSGPLQEPASAPPPLPRPMAPPSWSPPPQVAREPYPMRYDVAYPEGLSRLSTFFRLVLLLPVYLFVGLLQYFVYIALFLGFTTVFWRKKYPQWLFRGLSGAFGFQARASAYGLLLTDKFPSFAPEDSRVTLEYDDPPSGSLSRWRVLFWKALLLIPQLIVLNLIHIAVFAVTVIAWFGILLTGNYPRGLFQFSVGVQRWWWRIAGYFAGFNDRYPPYALSAEAPPASGGATVANGLVGGALAAGFVAIVAAGIVASNKHFTAEVDYALLQSGDQQPAYRFQEDFGEDEVTLRLTRAFDPGDELVQVLRPASNERVVVFQWTVVNGTGGDAYIGGGAARLKFEHDDGEDNDATKSVGAAFITVNNVVAPANVRAFGTATVQAVFVIPEDAEPLELRYRGGFSDGGVKYVFE